MVATIIFINFLVIRTKNITNKSRSSKFIPYISKPIFGGINKERAKAEPINFESNLYNLIYFCTVGPAGLEPATDGL